MHLRIMLLTSKLKFSEREEKFDPTKSLGTSFPTKATEKKLYSLSHSLLCFLSSLAEQLKSVTPPKSFKQKRPNCDTSIKILPNKISLNKGRKRNSISFSLGTLVGNI